MCPLCRRSHIVTDLGEMRAEDITLYVSVCKSAGSRRSLCSLLKFCKKRKKKHLNPGFNSKLIFPSLLRLRRLHSNNLHCDCHLSWLSDWLRARRGLAPFTQCMAPAQMRGLNVPDVQKKDFVCNGEYTPV